MNRIRLIPIKSQTVQLHQAPELVRSVVEQTLSLLERLPRDSRWGCFLAASDETGEIVGTCGFKDGPNERREVEIAYYTFPQYEGKGYATEMARRLLEIAQGYVVIAHTLPEENASTAILKKIGMLFVGEVIDPEDGRIWKWKLP